MDLSATLEHDRMYQDIYPKQIPRLRILESDRSALLFDPDLPAWARVNKTGLSILRYCNGHTSVAEMVRVVANQFHTTPEKVNHEVLAFLEKMAELGFCLLDQEARSRQMRLVSFRRQLSFEKYHHQPTKPKRMNLQLTRRCNLRCLHCFAGSSPDASGFLATDVIFRQTRAMAELGIKSIALSGGEPLMHPEIWKIIGGLSDFGFRVGLVTNGTLITERIAHQLVVTGIPLQISFDGATSATHNAVRGPRAFERSFQATRILKQAGMAEQLVWAFTPLGSNISEIDALVELALSAGVRTLRVNRLCKNGRAAMNDQRPAVNQTVDFYLRLLQLKRKHRNSISIEGDLLESIHISREQAAFSNCPLCEALKIDPDGYIFPCAQFVDTRFALGNINRQSLGDILARNRMLGRLRGIWYQRFTRRCSTCVSCDWQLICMGGCMAEAYAEYGSFWMPDPLCAARSATIEVALREVD